MMLALSRNCKLGIPIIVENSHLIVYKIGVLLRPHPRNKLQAQLSFR